MTQLWAIKALVLELRGESFAMNPGDSMTFSATPDEVAALLAQHTEALSAVEPGVAEPSERTFPPPNPKWAELDDDAFRALFHEMMSEDEARFGSEWRDEGSGLHRRPRKSEPPS